MMIQRSRRHAWLLGLALLPMVGCMGASDDRLGSNNASPDNENIDKGAPIKTKVQQERQDQGDTANIGKGTGRPNATTPTQTGGLGGNQPGQPPIPPGGLNKEHKQD